jgi:hypothetical protein
MKYPRNVYVLSALIALITFTTPAQASEKHRAKLLEGGQETPVVITGATGSFTMNIEGDSSFDFELTYEGIEGGA